MTIFHVTEVHTSSEPRIARVRENWRKLYRGKSVVPAHLERYEFSSLNIGDNRNLPLLVDVLQEGRKRASTGDIILLTNGDTLLHPKLPELLRKTLAVQGAVCSFRLNIGTFTRQFEDPPEALEQQYESDHGRDMFAFTFEWLNANWSRIPPMFVGEFEWDLCLAVMTRHSIGIPVRSCDDFNIRTKAELPLGYVLHERHKPVWLHIGIGSPAKLWNKAMAKGFYADNNVKHLDTL